jgi:hypothetical protein
MSVLHFGNLAGAGDAIHLLAVVLCTAAALILQVWLLRMFPSRREPRRNQPRQPDALSELRVWRRERRHPP